MRLVPLVLALGCASAAQTAPERRPVGAAESPRSADALRSKRGVAYHFCGLAGARGESDLRLMQEGLGWTYNWAERPHACGDGPSVEDALARAGVEFVPMVWGLVDEGRHCASGGPCFRVDNPGGPEACDEACGDIFAEGEMGGPGDACWECFHQPISRDDFAARVPEGARWLLGFNEPNFQGQSALTPDVAARAWVHLEHVAEARGLGIVGPATNFCATGPDAPPPARCIAPREGVEMVHLAWLEAFYDACSADGVAGRDCRIDHQATHAYDCHAIAWSVDLFARKAGRSPPTEAHCASGVRDADETGVDCGGNACPACSAWARSLFERPVWLTEFAHAPWGGCEDVPPEEMRSLALDFARRELPRLDVHPRLFRYAWFMPRVTGVLDHDDLLADDPAGGRTPLGELYLGGASR